MRLFTAVALPEDVLNELTIVQESLKKKLGQNFRFTPAEQLHITLKFIGEFPEDSLEKLSEKLKEAAAKTASGTISLSGLGAFPGVASARIIWAGINDRDGVLSSLFKLVDEATCALEVPAEKRPYTPHITLARLRRGRKLSEKIGPELTRLPINSNQFTVREFSLFSSKLTSEGAIHNRVKSFTLA
ncbi:MAG: RNA 2',3'-cyclic phosphodiesterase [Candidatus Dadabacteria bacterium]|nr:MAG: RNA 2',3'-cyclic phosphodiesterase [Candidatus Dadabacteria bacterium]